MELPFHKRASKRTFGRARQLKKVMTAAEKVMWELLRNRNLESFKFRRQHPIGRYILDFYCHEAKLVIEVDGKIHELYNNTEYDKLRTEELESHGLKVIRFNNEEVLNNSTKVLNEIKKHLTSTTNL
jgi:very-short-patch-repair endonuclease